MSGKYAEKIWQMITHDRHSTINGATPLDSTDQHKLPNNIIQRDSIIASSLHLTWFTTDSGGVKNLLLCPPSSEWLNITPVQPQQSGNYYVVAIDAYS